MEQPHETYEVGGFAFQTEQEAELAKKEQEGVRFIKQKMNMEDPEMVLQIYQTLLRQNLFETPVGYCFLNEIREYLIAVPAIQNQAVRGIPVRHLQVDEKKKKKKEKPVKEKTPKAKEKPSKEKKPVGKNTDYKARCYFFMLTTLILAISISTMMLLAATSDNINILNYENKLIDKYSAWEQELEEREAELKKLE